MTIPGVKTRKPTARVPWPCILVEGEEKAGKSWQLALLSRSQMISGLYWVDLNEGAGDEYGAIEGTNYEIVEHDGSYAQILSVVQALKAEARRRLDAGMLPLALGIDTGSAIWSGLKDWASSRAMTSNANKAKLARDPNAEITISQNLWNDAGNRWRKLQTELLTFPGIVVITARGKEVTDVDDNGRPIEGKKKWSVETHKELPFSATVWVRMFRERPAQIIGARSVYAKIVPGKDDPDPVPENQMDRMLEWLVFDALRCNAGTAHARDLVNFHGGGLLEHEKVQEPAQDGAQPQRANGVARQVKPKPAALAKRMVEARTDEELQAVWAEANRNAMLGDVVESAGGNVTLARLAGMCHAEFVRKAQEQPAQPATDGAPGQSEPPATGGAPDQPETPAPGGTAAVLAAAAQAPVPETGRPADTSGDLPGRSAQPDAPEDCKPTAARRGILSSLVALGLDEDAIAHQFGRPVAQVATRHLRNLVGQQIKSASDKTAQG